MKAFTASRVIAGVRLVISQRDDKDNKKNPWELLDFCLSDVEKFADPGTGPAKAPVEIEFEREEWEKDVAAVDTRWQAVAQPPYAVQAIKESTIKGGPKPHGAEKGGAEWGTVLHTMLDAAMNRPDTDLHSLAL